MAGVPVAFGRAGQGPRGAPQRAGRGGRQATGSLAALALVCYLLATREQLIIIVVVLSSLYPVVPVLLGVTALRERLSAAQAAGLAGAALSVVLLTATA
ncbi:hypothetical protein [Actinomadura macra]|uniref:hypothetical protein n=1 Tax=Actinomadura macra TaxID=46164 RepID=UPI00083491EC|nr:hypothetical protein [Actinomadura macra]